MGYAISCVAVGLYLADYRLIKYVSIEAAVLDGF